MLTSNILNYAKDLRRCQTDAEQKLWYFLRGHRYKGLKFKRQKPMGYYIVDFVCISLKLVIELDGGQHSQQLSYDIRRESYLRQCGFHVLRFWNHDVMLSIDSVLSEIDNQVAWLSKR